MKKIIVITDVHGKTINLEKLTLQFEDADHIFFLGDGFYDVKKTLIDEHFKKVVAVRGNWELYNLAISYVRFMDIEGVRFV
ncbi:MAG: metallophosphatase family protein, partial [Firmicutes bacterium]|nr:metallophosphatase family protein [Bacillota bacterium]